MRDRQLKSDQRKRDSEDAYHSRIDVQQDNLVPSIVQVIASLDNSSPDELPPLHDVVDPDALETLLTTADHPLSITFEYHTYRVTVSSDGSIRVLNEPDRL